MSGEEENLLKGQSTDKNYWDAVIILDVLDGINPEAKITVKKFRNRFKRAFKLEEISHKSDAIDKVISYCECSLKGLNETDETFIKNLFQVIRDSILVILSEQVMLETSQKLSVEKDEMIVKLKANEENLMVQADLDEYLLQMKKLDEENCDFQEVPPYGPFEKHDSNGFLLKRKYVEYFKRYDENSIEQPTGSLFQQKDRIRLIYSMLCGAMNVEYIKSLGIIKDFVPLSEPYFLSSLEKDWGNFKFSLKSIFHTQDKETIRIYFGEKIAIYFCWLEFLMKSMMGIGLISIGLTVLSLVFGNTDDSNNKITGGEFIFLLLALVFPIFSTIIEQLWLRYQSELSWKWGASDFKLVENQRPEFNGKYIKCPISGKIKKVKKKSNWVWIRTTVSVIVIGTFVSLVLATIAGLFMYKSTLDENTNGPLIVGIVNAIQIKAFNIIFIYVAQWLNDLENYEYPSEYNNNLTIKVFLFEFFNNYTSLFYIAFVKRHIEGCNDDNCINELTFQIGAIFITNLVLSFLEILVAKLIEKIKVWREKKALIKKFGIEPELTEEEKQAKLSNYEEPISDYVEVAISYGYVIIFGATFPLTSTLFLILVIVKTRVDAWKLCTLARRPFPDIAESIGVWFIIIQIVSVVGAITNIGIAVFTTDVLEIEESAYKWVTFLLFEHVILFFKVLASFLIPNVPYKVDTGKTWSSRMVNERLYGKVADVEKVREIRNLHFTRNGENYKHEDIKSDN
ncbi:hypothetical protein SteCoe_36201 [Stentor coeruleus]|uniref:Anoctamin transmembrane domain-containing protein n=1 Tax=Stentor coeruleus TaxID=5963 RepID=A0A1R2AQN0_9CILI|nr:hypothetical protein SteCoe_36201 [Stentor coeruleus]